MSGVQSEPPLAALQSRVRGRPALLGPGSAHGIKALYDEERFALTVTLRRIACALRSRRCYIRRDLSRPYD